MRAPTETAINTSRPTPPELQTSKQVKAEQNFKTNKPAPTERKIRGGYYTPHALADYLCNWAIRAPTDHVLEPSCGDGSFVSAATRLMGRGGRMTAVEIMRPEIEKAKQSVNGSAGTLEWRCGSFFDIAPELLKRRGYDVALGNPPFIRFQHFDKQERERAFRLLNSFGYRPNGLANAWIAFVQLSAELLRDGGRLAMVVPAELLQVKYAAELRERLPKLFEDVCLVAFDELVFPQIQQEVVLLLADGRRRCAGAQGCLLTKQVANGAALLDTEPTAGAVSHLPERYGQAGMKWTSLFLGDSEFQALQESAGGVGLSRLGDLADVDVGIVTGRNRFFVVSEQQVEQFGVNGHALNVVGRTSALKSIRFTRGDLSAYAKSNRSKLLNLKGLDRASFSPQLDEYIRQGEAQGVNKGYKCRIRDRWFDVPSVSVPDAFLYRQIHHAPLLSANEAGATATDTIHRVWMRAGVDRDRLCGAMVNSLTFAWSEICGRSYGGGVLELEPREAEELPVPYVFAEDLDLHRMDDWLRTGNVAAALDHGDEVLLRKGCGLSKAQISRLRQGWTRLRQRRHGRKRRRTTAVVSTPSPQSA